LASETEPAEVEGLLTGRPTDSTDLRVYGLVLEAARDGADTPPVVAGEHGQAIVRGLWPYREAITMFLAGGRASDFAAAFTVRRDALRPRPRGIASRSAEGPPLPPGKRGS
jgi:hypothetical protein